MSDHDKEVGKIVRLVLSLRALADQRVREALFGFAQFYQDKHSISILDDIGDYLKGLE